MAIRLSKKLEVVTLNCRPLSGFPIKTHVLLAFVQHGHFSEAEDQRADGLFRLRELDCQGHRVALDAADVTRRLLLILARRLRPERLLLVDARQIEGTPAI